MAYDVFDRRKFWLVLLHGVFWVQDSGSLSRCSYSQLDVVSQLRYIMIELRPDDNLKVRSRLLRSCPLIQYNAVATFPTSY